MYTKFSTHPLLYSDALLSSKCTINCIIISVRSNDITTYVTSTTIIHQKFTTALLTCRLTYVPLHMMPLYSTSIIHDICWYYYQKSIFFLTLNWLNYGSKVKCWFSCSHENQRSIFHVHGIILCWKFLLTDMYQNHFYCFVHSWMWKGMTICLNCGAFCEEISAMFTYTHKLWFVKIERFTLYHIWHYSYSSISHPMSLWEQILILRNQFRFSQTKKRYTFVIE